MKDPEKLNEIYGETVSLITPSGCSVVIRQQTGEDDDTISNAVDSEDGTSINKFVAAIVVDSDIIPNGKLSLPDILKMKLCDKYFILIASRIFSIGQILKFSFKWENILEPVDYEEDLAKFIWDYSKKEFPFNPTDPDYFPSRIKPHIHGKELSRDFTIRSGKKLRYNFYNGEGERYLLKLSEGLQSRNQEFIARELSWFVEDKWIKIQNFRSFTSIDMVDIRKDIDENDPAVNLNSELENPLTHEKINYPIVGTMDFFFPREI